MALTVVTGRYVTPTSPKTYDTDNLEREQVVRKEGRGMEGEEKEKEGGGVERGRI